MSINEKQEELLHKVKMMYSQNKIRCDCCGNYFDKDLINHLESREDCLYLDVCKECIDYAMWRSGVTE
jgi:late competence protein required for DNA uptake (superfamily II DNA/RNA helicase)